MKTIIVRFKSTMTDEDYEKNIVEVGKKNNRTPEEQIRAEMFVPPKKDGTGMEALEVDIA